MDAANISGNDLTFRMEYQGKPVAMNVDLVSVKEEGPDVVVNMIAYHHSSSAIETTLASSYPVQCTFKSPTELKPLSTWTPHQEILLHGKFGSNPKIMENCSLAAYVAADGKPAGMGSLQEVTGGSVRKLIAEQVFPRQS